MITGPVITLGPSGSIFDISGPFSAAAAGITLAYTCAGSATAGDKILTGNRTKHVILAAALLAVARAAGSSPEQTPEPRVIEIVAKRFAFEPAEITVTVGERVTLAVRSADGVHGLEIKKFKVKKEIPRGESVTIEFTASEAGRFPILCSEYCGDKHDEMKGTLVVKAQDAQGP